MNKLRKSPPRAFRSLAEQPLQSRTMSFALQSTTNPTATPALKQVSLAYAPVQDPIGSTTQEQYWAARAHTAETLLFATSTYHQELRVMATKQETQRSVGSSRYRKSAFGLSYLSRKLTQ